MEGIAALSLTCNIVQLVGFAGSAIRVITQVHRDGQTKENHAIESVTNRLRDLCETIDSQLKSSALDTRVHEIARENVRLADELVSKLSKLKGDGSVWTKLKTGVKAVRQRKTIESLQQRLSACEDTIRTGLLAILMERNEASNVMQEEAFARLDSTLQDFIVKLSRGQTQISDLVKAENTEMRALVLQTQNKLASHMESLRLSEQRLQLLASLRYPEMNARWNQIFEADPCTYHSFFEVSIPHADVLIKWLSEGEGVMWIQGKAGSGKSTLMKFIAQSPTVRNLMNSQNSNLAILHHSFWLSGSLPQRDLHGMLSGLAYQVIELLDDLQNQSKLYTSDWSIKDLENFVISALHTLNTSASMAIVILVDALDEYDEQCGQRRLLAIINKFAEYSKVCVSSRSEPFWVKHLQYTARVKLEDINRVIIRAFIEQEFESAGVVDQSHVKNLTSRAQGMFLWACLASRNVLKGLDSNATKDELQRRINCLPKGIENLYTSMLQRVEEDWSVVRQEAAVFFSTALFFSDDQFGWPVFGNASLYTFYVTSSLYITREPLIQDLAGLDVECKRLRERISFACAGMLETKPPWFASFWKTKFLQLSVKFTHRSVQDFLLDVSAARNLTLVDDWNVATVVCRWVESLLILFRLCANDMSWDFVATRLEDVQAIQTRYMLDEADHLRMILSVREILIAAGPSPSSRFPKYVEFMDRRQVQLSPGLERYRSQDFLGLTIEVGMICYFDSLGIEVASFSVQYMEYLLFCAIREASDKFSQRFDCYDTIWKLVQSHGVTGKTEYWRQSWTVCNFLMLTKCSVDATLLDNVLSPFMDHDRIHLESAFRQLQGSDIEADKCHSYYITTKGYHIARSLEVKNVGLEGDSLPIAMYVEGNLKYWLSTALSLDGRFQALQPLFLRESWSTVVPFRRLRFLLHGGDDSEDFCGVPILMNGKLCDNDEDGEKLLQLWETSRSRSRESDETSKQDQDAIKKEADRLVQKLKPVVDRMRPTNADGPDSSHDGGHSNGNNLMHIHDYEFLEGIIRNVVDEDELPEIPVFKSDE